DATAVILAVYPSVERGFSTASTLELSGARYARPLGRDVRRQRTLPYEPEKNYCANGYDDGHPKRWCLPRRQSPCLAKVQLTWLEQANAGKEAKQYDRNHGHCRPESKHDDRSRAQQHLQARDYQRH
ncbi:MULTISPECIES: hypothetical protein, partial [unclassified Rhodanobacter]|uniref:hypothetical protein n=1 Tax=unclassified Rhodanobacter TaxID=2621553 RepID=UPI001F359118